MESLDKHITQDGLDKAANELLELEIKKSTATDKELEEIEQREKEIYELYPMLDEE